MNHFFGGFFKVNNIRLMFQEIFFDIQSQEIDAKTIVILVPNIENLSIHIISFSHFANIIVITLKEISTYSSLFIWFFVR